MVKIAIFGIGRFEEQYLDRCEEKYPEICFVRVRRKVSAENAWEARGCYAVVVSSAQPPTEELLKIWKECGVKYVATRSIGIDHMDVPLIESFGMHAAHTTYSPASVADFAIMLMLMVTRNMKILQKKYEAHDFREGDFAGKELWNMTVGILGTGAIGEMVIRHLSGFGCRILASSRHEKESLKGLAEYVDTDTLLRESDLVSIHMAAVPENEHFLDEQRLSA